MSEQIVCPFCGAANENGRFTCHNCQTNLQEANRITSLTERVAALENMVAALQGQKKRAGSAVAPAEPTAVPAPVALSPTLAAPKPSRLPENMWQSDFWFNKIGLGLLLLALAFLFNYAVDQGWLTPAVRLAIGLLLGTALLGMGYRISGQRRHFGQVLQGGGIAAYFITGFAAFQLYALVSYPLAFGFMVLVTGLAFLLSLRQKEAILSLIGGLGGLATPFLLYTGEGSPIGLILYTCLICASLVAIYFFQGWQAVQWLTNTGGWVILLVAGDLIEARTVAADTLVLQGSILFCLLLFWGVPVLRQLAWTIAPEKRPQAKFGLADSLIPYKIQAFFNKHLLAIVANPLIALILTWILWQMTPFNEGLLSLGMVALFGLVAWGLSQRADRGDLAYFHGGTAVLFLTLAVTQLLPRDWHFFAWAAELLALHWLSRQIQRPSLRIVAHLFSLMVGIWLLGRVLGFGVGTAVWNQPALIDLSVIGLILAASFVLPHSTEPWLRSGYRLGVHIAMLCWLWREFSFPPDGQGFVTIAWGVYALILLGVAFRFHFKQLRLVAVATLFLLVGKLFFVDLVAVATVWRILLFAGFGSLFLFISYFYSTWLGLPEHAK
jgi:uncharacterized membrane protein